MSLAEANDRWGCIDRSSVSEFQSLAHRAARYARESGAEVVKVGYGKAATNAYPKSTLRAFFGAS